MRTLIRTDDVPAGDAAAYYREAVAAIPVPVEFRCAEPDGFWAQMEAIGLGGMTVTLLSARTRGPYEVRRTQRLIRRSDPEAYRLLLTMRGQQGLTHNDRTAVLDPYDFALYDTSRPFNGWRAASADPDRTLMLTFPRQLLPLDPLSVGRLLGMSLPSRSGIGRLVSGALAQMARDVGEYQPKEALRVARLVLDLLTELLSYDLDMRATVSLKPLQRSMLTRIQEFIQERLSDPGLSAEQIAVAHHISTRSLHRLFQASGTPVAEWTRSQRVDACRRDLASPHMRHHTVQAIALRWGFVDAAHFNRVFRVATGISPRAYRQQAMAQSDNETGVDSQVPPPTRF